MQATLIYAIGDIHGSYDKLARLLEHCRRHGGSRPVRFVFLGDYIDRGPDSRDVVDLLIRMQASAPRQISCLYGNHEDMLINTSTEGDEITWLHNDGDMTLRSYGVDSAGEIPVEHLAWFRSLPVSISDGRRLFVHAGIQPSVPLDLQQRHTMLWIREPFLSDQGDHGQYVVHGHTPLRSGQPEHLSNRLNLDTGAVFGGPLTAAAFDDIATGPLAFITDEGLETPAPALTEIGRQSRDRRLPQELAKRAPRSIE
jgi:Calcineurin-like phosphoesterase